MRNTRWTLVLLVSWIGLSAATAVCAQGDVRFALLKDLVAPDEGAEESAAPEGGAEPRSAAGGEKWALCIGISNYPNADTVPGAVNSAQAWAEALEARGYQVRRLIDKQATKEQIIQGMLKLVGRIQAGDRLVITFNGHGGTKEDHNGEAGEGKDDECLVPYDYRKGDQDSMLSDDEVAAVFQEKKDQRAKVVFIADSCFSGGMNRSISLSGRPAPSAAPAPRAEASGRYAYPALIISSCAEKETAPYGSDAMAFSFFAQTTLKDAKTAAGWVRATRALMEKSLPEDKWRTPDIHGSAADRNAPPF